MRYLSLVMFFSSIFQPKHSEALATGKSLNDDILHPYENHYINKRSVNLSSLKKVNESLFETWSAHNSSALLPATDTRYFVSDIWISGYGRDTHVYGHYTLVRNPHRTFSVFEAKEGGCQSRKQATVQETAISRHCLVAQNGGFFNTETHDCLGNIISQGKFVHNSNGVQNVNFGITNSGLLITGYLTDSDIRSFNFTQLIGGVVWLVKNGKPFVDQAGELEEEVEETGTLKYFIDVQSARTAIGHDKEGRVVFVQLDGQTSVRGANLRGFARFLIDEVHLVNAINLDGGGSATLVLNGSLASYPSDHCKQNPAIRCAREISTVICAHRPICLPDCLHGECVDGVCKCNMNWIGAACDALQCSSHNCSHHGICSAGGCSCQPGWHSDDCSVPCSRGYYGNNCSQVCSCRNGAACDRITGVCDCMPGYQGLLCDQECSVGRYGKNCKYHCHCSETCFCHHETGVCLESPHANHPAYESFVHLSRCVATSFWNSTTSRLQNIQTPDNFLILWLLCGTTALLVFSVAANIGFMWKSLCGKSKQQSFSVEYHSVSSDESSNSSDTGTWSETTSDDKFPRAERVSSVTAYWRRLRAKLLDRRGSGYLPLNATDEAIELVQISSAQQERESAASFLIKK